MSLEAPSAAAAREATWWSDSRSVRACRVHVVHMCARSDLLTLDVEDLSGGGVTERTCLGF
eukprot:scaffold51893_cov57-Phaeocystis_antarctica.AAC.2